jgi:2-dehydro-3-deoxy-D-arabinonate dehydratase
MKMDFILLENEDWDSFTNDDALLQKMIEKIKNLSPAQNNSNQILAPVGSNPELWACGVIYLRSKIGRQEASKVAGEEPLDRNISERRCIN